LAALLSAGRSVGEDPAAVETAEPLQTFVATMKQIDSSADRLRASAPEPVAAQLHKIMRRLVDHTYRRTSVHLPDWTEEEATLEALSSSLRKTLRHYSEKPVRGGPAPADDKTGSTDAL
jgi:hypothetical protein